MAPSLQPPAFAHCLGRLLSGEPAYVASSEKLPLGSHSFWSPPATDPPSLPIIGLAGKHGRASDSPPPIVETKWHSQFIRSPPPSDGDPVQPRPFRPILETFLLLFFPFAILLLLFFPFCHHMRSLPPPFAPILDSRAFPIGHPASMQAILSGGPSGADENNQNHHGLLLHALQT